MNCQWKVAKAKEAFYSKVNRSALRMPPAVQQQQGTSLQQGSMQVFYKNLVIPFWKCQNTEAPAKDPNVVDVDRGWAQHPTIRCYNCNKDGHMAKDCRAPRKIRMIQAQIKEVRDFLDEQKWQRKTAKRLNARRIFPMQSTENAPTEVEEQVSWTGH